MKTLDEVITVMDHVEFCCTNCKLQFDCDEVECFLEDALHYLKEYREMLNVRIYIPEGYTKEKTGFTHQDFANTFGGEPHFIRDFMVGTSQNFADTSQITCPKCHSEFVILPEANNALTWEQLKQMDGKPVWMEADDGKYKRWFIVGNFFSWFEKEDFDAHVNLYHSGGAMEMSKETYGFYWQAYRKERNEDAGSSD